MANKPLLRPLFRWERNLNVWCVKFLWKYFTPLTLRWTKFPPPLTEILYLSRPQWFYWVYLKEYGSIRINFQTFHSIITTILQIENKHYLHTVKYNTRGSRFVSYNHHRSSHHSYHYQVSCWPSASNIFIRMLCWSIQIYSLYKSELYVTKFQRPPSSFTVFHATCCMSRDALVTTKVLLLEWNKERAESHSC